MKKKAVNSGWKGGTLCGPYASACALCDTVTRERRCFRPVDQSDHLRLCERCVSVQKHVVGCGG